MRGTRRRLFELGAALALVCVPAVARAEVALSGPEGCSDVATFRARVTALLPKDAALPTAVVVVEDAAPRLRASVRIAGAAPRVFEGPSCEALLEAVALVLAMGAKAPTSSDAAPPTPTAAPSERAEEPRVPPRLGTAVTLAAEGTAAIGPLPSAALGGGLAIGVDVGLFRAEARGAMFGGQHAAVAGTAEGRVDLGLASVGTRGCFVFPLGPIRLGPCASLDVLVFSAVGQGVGNATSDGTIAFSAAAGGLVLVPIADSVSLRAGIEAGLLPSTNAFVVQPAGTVHEAGRGLGRVSFGLEVRL